MLPSKWQCSSHSSSDIAVEEANETAEADEKQRREILGVAARCTNSTD